MHPGQIAHAASPRDVRQASPAVRGRARGGRSTGRARSVDRVEAASSSVFFFESVVSLGVVRDGRLVRVWLPSPLFAPLRARLLGWRDRELVQLLPLGLGLQRALGFVVLHLPAADGDLRLASRQDPIQVAARAPHAKQHPALLLLRSLLHPGRDGGVRLVRGDRARGLHRGKGASRVGVRSERQRQRRRRVLVFFRRPSQQRVRVRLLPTQTLRVLVQKRALGRGVARCRFGKRFGRAARGEQAQAPRQGRLARGRGRGARGGDERARLGGRRRPRRPLRVRVRRRLGACARHRKWRRFGSVFGNCQSLNGNGSLPTWHVKRPTESAFRERGVGGRTSD